MAWKEGATSWRTTPRPAGWQALRAQALSRDGYQCTWTREDGTRCTARGTDADHIGAPDDHSLANLRALCGHHHRKRTAIQARAARAAAPPRKRPAETHPGLATTSGAVATSSSSNRTVSALASDTHGRNDTSEAPPY